MIQVKNISHHFGKFKALSDVSFDIASGEIIGLLGENGAGKTTLMRILTTFLSPSFGSAVVAGHDVVKSPMLVRQKIGYLPENLPLYLSLNVLDYLKFAAHLKGVSAKNLKTRLDWVIDECQLKDVAKRSIGTLSKGYKQRVGLAQAIIHDPAVLILDEPSSGLDPVQTHYLRQSIKALEQKRTVIVSTHILSEIEHIAKRAIVIKQGNIIADQSVESFVVSNTLGRRIKVTLQGRREKVQSLLTVTPGIVVQAIEENGQLCEACLQLDHQIKDMEGLINRLHEAQGKIISIEEIKPSLEEVFRKLVGNP